MNFIVGARPWFRSLRATSAAAGEPETSIPPSPVVICLLA